MTNLPCRTSLSEQVVVSEQRRHNYEHVQPPALHLRLFFQNYPGSRTALLPCRRLLHSPNSSHREPVWFVKSGGILAAA